MDDTGAIILAGGSSSRFGTPKPFLRMTGGSTFLERLVNIYLEFGCKEIILVMNQNHFKAIDDTFPESFRSKFKVVYNNRTGLGRFYSLKLGAGAVLNCVYCFMQNIDNPFTDLSTLKKLYINRKPDAYISPVYQSKGGHPVLIPQMIIEKIINEPNINLNIKDFLNQFIKIKAEIENSRVLANINTPEDYNIYFEQPA